MGDRFTEFYILGAEGNAADYPQELALGEEGSVAIGIINHEYETVSYRIEVMVDGVKSSQVEPPALENDEEWKGEISFVPEAAGENQSVEFFLYKDGEDEPCLEPLRLWIDVTQ